MSLWCFVEVQSLWHHFSISSTSKAPSQETPRVCATTCVLALSLGALVSRAGNHQSINSPPENTTGTVLMKETAAAPSPTKKARHSWFEALVTWVNQSPHGFVAEQTVSLDSNRTLRTIKHVAEGEILFRVPAITAGTTDAHLAWYLANRPASIHPYLASLPTDASLPRTIQV